MPHGHNEEGCVGCFQRHEAEGQDDASPALLLIMPILRVLVTLLFL